MKASHFQHSNMEKIRLPLHCPVCKAAHECFTNWPLRIYDAETDAEKSLPAIEVRYSCGAVLRSGCFDIYDDIVATGVVKLCPVPSIDAMRAAGFELLGSHEGGDDDA